MQYLFNLNIFIKKNLLYKKHSSTYIDYKMIEFVVCRRIINVKMQKIYDLLNILTYKL